MECPLPIPNASHTQHQNSHVLALKHMAFPQGLGEKLSIFLSRTFLPTTPSGVALPTQETYGRLCTSGLFSSQSPSACRSVLPSATILIKSLPCFKIFMGTTTEQKFKHLRYSNSTIWPQLSFPAVTSVIPSWVTTGQMFFLFLQSSYLYGLNNCIKRYTVFNQHSTVGYLVENENVSESLVNLVLEFLFYVLFFSWASYLTSLSLIFHLCKSRGFVSEVFL